MAGSKYSSNALVFPIMLVDGTNPAAIASIKANIAQVASEVSNMGKQANKAGKEASKGLDDFDKTMNSIRWKMVNTSFIGAFASQLAQPFLYAAKLGAEFEQQLVRIQSVTGQSVAESTSVIMEARKGTPFSVTEVAGGYLEFAKAGYSAADSTKALDSIMNLAIISSMELDTASKSVAMTLSQFSLSASDAAMVVDTISSVADNTLASVEGLTAALSYAGVTAAEAGQDFKETVVVLGMLTNAGMDQERAGTALRQVYAALLDPSKKSQDQMRKLGVSFIDASGNMKPLLQFMSELRYSMEGLSTGQRQSILADMFEVRSLVAVNAMIQDLDAMDGQFGSIKASADASGSSFLKAFQLGQTGANNMKNAMETFKASYIETTKIISDSQKSSGWVDLADFFGKLAGSIVTGSGILVKGFTNVIANVFNDPTNIFDPSKMSPGSEIAKILFGDNTEKEIKARSSMISSQLSKSMSNVNVPVSNFVEQYSASTQMPSFIEKEFGADARKNIDITIGQMKNIANTRGQLLKLANDAREKGDSAEAEKWLEMAAQQDLMLISLQNNFSNYIGKLDEANSIAGKTNGYQKLMNDIEQFRVSIDNLGTDLEAGALEKFINPDKTHEASKALEDIFNIDAIDTFVQSAYELKSINIFDATTMMDYKHQLRGLTNDVITYENQLIELNAQKTVLERVVKNDRDSLADEREELSRLNEELKRHEEIITKVQKARFTGETRIMNITDRANTWLKKQQFAQLETLSAQEFLNQALNTTNSEFENMFATLSKTNSALENNKSAFEAWQKTIQEEIKAEVAAGQSLGMDVTQRTKIRQTQLMGIENISGSEKGSTALDDFINKLELASSIVYDSQRNEVENFTRTWEDSKNGVYNSSQDIISILQREYSTRDSLESQIISQTNRVTEAENRLEISTDRLNSVITAIADKEDAIKTAMTDFYDLAIKFKDYSSSLVNQVQTGTLSTKGSQISGSASIDTAREERNRRSQELLNMYKNGPIINVNDALIRPGMNPVVFNPQDTIIATKSGGVGSNVNVTINMQSNGNTSYDAYELARQIKLQLGR